MQKNTNDNTDNKIKNHIKISLLTNKKITNIRFAVSSGIRDLFFVCLYKKIVALTSKKTKIAGMK